MRASTNVSPRRSRNTWTLERRGGASGFGDFGDCGDGGGVGVSGGTAGGSVPEEAIGKKRRGQMEGLR